MTSSQVTTSIPFECNMLLRGYGSSTRNLRNIFSRIFPHVPFSCLGKRMLGVAAASCTALRARRSSFCTPPPVYGRSFHSRSQRSSQLNSDGAMAQVREKRSEQARQLPQRAQRQSRLSLLGGSAVRRRSWVCGSQCGGHLAIFLDP